MTRHRTFKENEILFGKIIDILRVLYGRYKRTFLKNRPTNILSRTLVDVSSLIYI